MGVILQIVFSLILFLGSLSAFALSPVHAHKIEVTGYPIHLENPRSTYLVPNYFETGNGANFVTLDNQKHVCYLKPQPELSALDNKIIAVEVKGSLLYWTCYEFDTNYFIIKP
ncbi:hypothetical protein [Legionella worsleiensis]|uniref:Secreted protein n=1 Tax=Legionella worsleiensis TaxID=45076 RepID=A0A0W1ALG4_9GAMM|nr:hypothetical protein [Legionella worsleiensis]KTD82096.1 hypothetical protein Lwor_0016 [Legionella worsleiensis]STY31473.1 Uncharacterised protein [Legionella worsleiensis]